jgi:hypothetical protein
MKNVLKLPRTQAGRDDLIGCIKCIGGWIFPDGESVADIDWDEEAAKMAVIYAKVDAENARIDEWLRGQEGGK